MNIFEKLSNNKLMPLYFNEDFDKCYTNIKACYDAGIPVFEFTNRGANALELFKQLKEKFDVTCPDLSIGIGTIYTVEQAESFIAAGAAFIVQPICTPEVGEVCIKHNLPWIPGVMTLNEIYNAYAHGATLIKVFPASVLGPGYIKAIKGPLPQAKIMVTGGVEATISDVQIWLNAGVNVCGLGSQLFNQSADEITSTLKGILQKI
jgi:2-dehydro-3-deoxyphosphogluconate aldolase / (4S)-4-hydroxy-2-oxoglutarate aldolase